MKKITAIAAILIFVAVFLSILLLTKIANQIPPPPPPGYAFWLYAQHVVECSPTEITLVDNHQTETHLVKDEDSWPPCSKFNKNDVLDFYLSRGETTHYLRVEQTSWWRKAM
jgi:hypothetical protein